MADDLRAALLLTDTGAVAAPVRPMTRLIVLPFRVLRADPEIDFLVVQPLGRADDVAVGARLARRPLEPDRLALRARDASISTRSPSKADVDAVLTGTLLRAGDQLRVTAQLAEVPGGTVRWSQTTQVRSATSSSSRTRSPAGSSSRSPFR